MNKLFNSMKIRNLEVKNRIAVPPMVIYNRTDDTGYVTDIQVEHYRKIAQGGPGLIIPVWKMTEDSVIHRLVSGKTGRSKD